MEGFSTQKVAKRISNPAELRPQSKEKAATRWQPSVSEQRSARIEMSTIEGAAIEKLIFNKRRSNFIRVREQLKPYLIAKYGMIGTFIERDDYPPYPAIPADNAPVFIRISRKDFICNFSASRNGVMPPLSFNDNEWHRYNYIQRIVKSANCHLKLLP